MRVAIVGGGLSGANILKGLLSHPKLSTDDKIDVYEAQEFIGPGFPYRIDEDDSIMLNTAPRVNSQNQNNPDDFVNWLDDNYENPTNFEGLVSRKQYGKYLIEHFKDYANHQQVTHIQQTVEDIETITTKEKDCDRHSFTYRLKTNQGWQAPIYDAVFLCVGHPPYHDYYNLLNRPNFIHNPYPMIEKLNEIENHQKVAIIGSGATGVDAMRFIMTHYELDAPLSFFDIDEPLDFISIPYENDKVSMTFSQGWIYTQKEKYDGFIPLKIIVDKILHDLKTDHVELVSVYECYQANDLQAKRTAFEINDQNLAATQQYFSQLVPLMPDLYNAFTADDRNYYRKNYHSIMTFFKTRVPHLTYKWMFQLIDTGKLTLHGDLKDVKKLSSGKFNIITETNSYEMDVIINATGFDTELENIREHSTLINNLYNKRIVLPQENGQFVLINWPQSCVMNQRYGTMDNLFFLGAHIGGTQHENNDIGLISEHALFVAQKFMDYQK